MARSTSRREFLTLIGLGLIGAACTSKIDIVPTPSVVPPNPGSIDDLTKGTARLDLLSSLDVHSPIDPGKNRFAFGLVTGSGGLITGGSPQVYLAQDRTSKALGPFPATFYPFTGYARFHDRSPKTPLTGTYLTELDIPGHGDWLVLALANDGTGPASATGKIEVTSGTIVAAIGSKAISVKTPVATSDHGLREICTRTPPDHMHSISLDQALNNGKPTVVSFATPLLCESQLCGPVVDEQLVAFSAVGPDKANFIHVEEFLPGPDLKPDGQTLSPGFTAWGFTSEPWVIVIDKGGIIRGRFGPGPTVGPEILASLQPLL